VPEAGVLKINNLPQLQKELTQNFSNYNDCSGSESCQDSSFSEVYLLLSMQSLVRCHVTHTPKCNEPAKIRENYCGLTILLATRFSLCCLRITTKVANLAFLKPLAIFGNKKSRQNLTFSGVFQLEKLGSGKILSNLRIHYKSLLTRVCNHAGCTEYCKDFTVALKVMDVSDKKKFTTVYLRGKKMLLKIETVL